MDNTGMASARRVLFLSFLILTGISCASSLPAYDPANYTQLPPLTGAVCDADMKAALGEVECDTRIAVFVKRGLAASVKIVPANYGSTKVSGQQFGSGVLISKDGYVLTANHVLKGSKYALVIVRQVGGIGLTPQFEDRGSVIMDVVRIDVANDLALLRPVEPNTFEIYAEPGNTNDLPTGAKAWHFGRASLALAGPTYAIDPSEMRTSLKNIEGLTALATKVQKGDSGAGVVALDGKLVGILVGDGEGVLPGYKDSTFGLFVPIDVVIGALQLDTLPVAETAPAGVPAEEVE